jgi:hypothetical protein
MSRFEVLAGVSGVAFLLYGFSCLLGTRMRREFDRFGLAKFCTLVGVLEVLGGAGVLLGLRFPLLLLVAATGLTLLMVSGAIVRIRVRDGLVLALPALVFGAVNGYLALHVWRRLAS